MLHAELKSKIRKLWDKFWSGGISNPLQAIEQISYLIFMKKLEDKDILDEQNASLGGETSHYSAYMKDATFSLPTASLLIEAVSIINALHIKEQNQDTQGDIYEYLLS